LLLVVIVDFREVEQFAERLLEGSYGRRNRQAIAARETRVAARLRAVCTSVIRPTIAARRTNEWAGALPGSREDAR
jgi:hypothetical protein